MPERVPKCPNCGANLTVGRHDLITTCPFCRATVKLDPDLVEVARFRDAFAAWDDPSRHARAWTTIAGTHWIIGERVASGETADVHAATRARTPTEAAFVRIVRDPLDTPRLERAAAAMQRLRQSKARGASLAPRRLPELITRGIVESGNGRGRMAVVTRVARQHPLTLAALRGMSAVQSVWVWRRVLEVLTMMHESGVVHGAITPAHVLVEAGEHGARLVGLGNAGEAGEPLAGRDRRYAAMYPSMTLSPRADVQMSGRMFRALVGDTPAPYQALLDEVAGTDRWDAWALREELGRLGRLVFGPPRFCPLLPR